MERLTCSAASSSCTRSLAWSTLACSSLQAAEGALATCTSLRGAEAATFCLCSFKHTSLGQIHQCCCTFQMSGTADPEKHLGNAKASQKAQHTQVCVGSSNAAALIFLTSPFISSVLASRTNESPPGQARTDEMKELVKKVKAAGAPAAHTSVCWVQQCCCPPHNVRYCRH